MKSAPRVCRYWIGDKESGRKMCGGRVGDDEPPFTMRIGVQLRKYVLCSEHKLDFNRRAIDFFAQLQDLIASDSDIFGSEDVGEHSESAHLTDGVAKTQARARRQTREIITQVIVDDLVFRYPVVVQELDRLGYAPPRTRLQKADIAKFEELFHKGLVDRDLSTPVKN